MTGTSVTISVRQRPTRKVLLMAVFVCGGAVGGLTTFELVAQQTALRVDLRIQVVFLVSVWFWVQFSNFCSSISDLPAVLCGCRTQRALMYRTVKRGIGT